MAGVECGDQILVHQMAAARHIDDEGVLRQLREQRRIQDAARVRRQRQQADKDVGAWRETRRALALRQNSSRREHAPSCGSSRRDSKSQIAQPLGGQRADLAQAQNADARVFARASAAAPAAICVPSAPDRKNAACGDASAHAAPNCAISRDSVGSTKRTSGTCFGIIRIGRKPSTPAPSENTALRFGSVLGTRAAGGRSGRNRYRLWHRRRARPPRT